jgi:hypothetical protein
LSEHVLKLIVDLLYNPYLVENASRKTGYARKKSGCLKD